MATLSVSSLQAVKEGEENEEDGGGVAIGEEEVKQECGSEFMGEATGGKVERQKNRWFAKLCVKILLDSVAVSVFVFMFVELHKYK